MKKHHHHFQRGVKFTVRSKNSLFTFFFFSFCFCISFIYSECNTWVISKGQDYAPPNKRTRKSNNVEKVREKDMSDNKKTIKISHHTVCFSEVKEYFNTHKGIHRFGIPQKKKLQINLTVTHLNTLKRKLYSNTRGKKIRKKAQFCKQLI